MKKTVIASATVVLAALLLSGCAAKEEKTARADVMGQPMTIVPGDFLEECDMDKNWTPGARVSVNFTSSAPVMFNVHYHEKHAKMYAVEQTVTDHFEGSFIVQGEGIHCGMWKNDTDKDVTLTYNIGVEKQ